MSVEYPEPTGSIEPTAEQFERLATIESEGPVVMLRFKEQADGTSDPAYLEIHGHRAPALAHSRLIACKPLAG